MSHYVMHTLLTEGRTASLCYACPGQILKEQEGITASQVFQIISIMDEIIQVNGIFIVRSALLEYGERDQTSVFCMVGSKAIITKDNKKKIKKCLYQFMLHV